MGGAPMTGGIPPMRGMRWTRATTQAAIGFSDVERKLRSVRVKKRKAPFGLIERGKRLRGRHYERNEDNSLGRKLGNPCDIDSETADDTDIDDDNATKLETFEIDETDTELEDNETGFEDAVAKGLSRTLSQEFIDWVDGLPIALTQLASDETAAIMPAVAMAAEPLHPQVLCEPPPLTSMSELPSTTRRTEEVTAAATAAAHTAVLDEPIMQRCSTCHRNQPLENFRGKANPSRIGKTCQACLGKKKNKESRARLAAQALTSRLITQNKQLLASNDELRRKLPHRNAGKEAMDVNTELVTTLLDDILVDSEAGVERYMKYCREAGIGAWPLPHSQPLEQQQEEQQPITSRHEQVDIPNSNVPEWLRR